MLLWYSAGKATLWRAYAGTVFSQLGNNNNNEARPSVDGRVTSDHCRVTLQWLFTKNFRNAWNIQETMFDSRPTVARPPTSVAWPFCDYFQNFSKLLETSKNVAWQSGDGRVTSDHCRITVQRLSSKKSSLLVTSKKRCLTVGQRPRDLRPLSHDRSVIFFLIFPIARNVRKMLLTVGRQSRDPRPLSRDHSVTFFKNFLFAWNVQKTLFDRRPTLAWPPPTVTWTLSYFFQKVSQLLETTEKICFKVSKWSRDCPATLIPCFFSYGFRIC